jgi:hypothetical protein
VNLKSLAVDAAIAVAVAAFIWNTIVRIRYGFRYGFFPWWGQDDFRPLYLMIVAVATACILQAFL